MEAAPQQGRERAFEVSARDPESAARAGTLTTAHGVLETPFFMPVATQGTVKGLTPAQVRELGARIVLANVYHLALRPGATLIASLGGLHRFMAWDGAILTDSGGYQIMSLAALRRVSEEGVVFRSHLDGRRLSLTPENVVGTQVQLGADILMQLDECVPAGVDRETARAAMERSLRWAVRSRACALQPERHLFAIVQGGIHFELRREHVERLAQLGFPGYAVGGLSVGEDREVTRDVAAATAAALPQDRPRYLMGVGLPEDLLRFIGMGYDMFDCVLPTRNARNGMLFTRRGKLNIRLARHAGDSSPVDPLCECYTCRSFSRAYLRHLAAAGEMLGAQLATLHNLHFYLGLMREARARISAGTYTAWARQVVAEMEGGGAS